MKLSVVTASLNAGIFIRQTIESVMSQNHPDFEHIIIDGGSTDGTLEIIQDYAARDSRIIWISEADRGISDAMNKGVQIAAGDVVAHLNADDYFAHAGVLTRVADSFSSNSAEWLTSGIRFVTEDGTLLQDVRVRRYSFRRLLRGNIILHPATFVRRAVFLELGGFDPGLQYCMDYDLFLRLGGRSAPLQLDDLLTCFRVHPDSRSVLHSAEAFAEEYRVRMNTLRQKGRATWPYRLDFLLKKHLNRLFYRRLLASGSRPS